MAKKDTIVIFLISVFITWVIYGGIPLGCKFTLWVAESIGLL